MNIKIHNYKSIQEKYVINNAFQKIQILENQLQDSNQQLTIMKSENKNLKKLLKNAEKSGSPNE